jgi:hypothetical protein
MEGCSEEREREKEKRERERERGMGKSERGGKRQRELLFCSNASNSQREIGREEEENSIRTSARQT